MDDKNTYSAKISISDDDTQEELDKKIEEIKRRDTEIDTLNKARDLGIGYVNLQGVRVAEEALRVIPEDKARQLRAVCFYYIPYRELRIGTVDIENPDLVEYAKDLQKKKNTKVRIYLISVYSLEEVLNQYSRLPKISHVVSKVEISYEDLSKFNTISSFQQIQEEAHKVNTTELLNLIVAAAIKFDASDIHIESEEDSIIVRYRLDGILHEVARMDKKILKQLSTRIKILSDLKINVVDKPQDGHFTIEVEGKRIDVRVSTIPTNFGESIVMRLLRYDIGLIRLEELGIPEYYMSLVEREIHKPNGMVIVCGPTGSGKSTTLYAVLNKLKEKENKIITIEDPIEYQIEGITQTQVDPKKGYTFASGLRALVRQDPDIILVGEIRDEETVDIAVNAALTGHLVLSTLHTNNAAGAVPRFLSMGAKPYLLAPALSLVIGQRLVRRLCKFCRVQADYSEEKISEIKKELENLPPAIREKIGTEYVFYRPSENGCRECLGLGYKGRIGIYEMFVVDSDVEKIIISKGMAEDEIKQTLVSKGMVTMVQDGLLKALEGITSVDEVYRVIAE